MLDQSSEGHFSLETFEVPDIFEFDFTFLKLFCFYILDFDELK